MTTPGDRKLFKATSFAALDTTTFQHLFDEFGALSVEPLCEFISPTVGVE